MPTDVVLLILRLFSISVGTENLKKKFELRKRQLLAFSCSETRSQVKNEVFRLYISLKRGQIKMRELNNVFLYEWGVQRFTRLNIDDIRVEFASGQAASLRGVILFFSPFDCLDMKVFRNVDTFTYVSLKDLIIMSPSQRSWESKRDPSLYSFACPVFLPCK